jgi:hypothetical protein
MKAYVALVTLFAAAGCASSPEVADEALGVTTAATAASATTAAATFLETPANTAALATTSTTAATPVAATEEPGTVVPVTVVDVNELVASQSPPVVCREVLKRGSNVHINLCGTAEQWKRYARQEAEDAAALTRMMQGGRYR